MEGRPALPSGPQAQAGTCPASLPDLQRQLLLTLPTGLEAADSVLSPLSLRIQTGACSPEGTLIDTHWIY